MASVAVRLSESRDRRPGVGYRIDVTLTVKARLVIPGLADDIDDLGGGRGRPGSRPTGPRTNVVFQIALAGTASGTSGADGRVAFSIDTRGAEQQLLGSLSQIPGASGSIVEHRATVTVEQPSGALLIHESRKQRGATFGFSLTIPRRRVVILDIDGLRWDVLYRHLKRVRDAGAGLTQRYRFEPRPDASDDTVIESGKDLRSGLAFLCFGDESGMVDVRMARAPYPSYTFPSHATMFTGVWPGRHGITGNEFAERAGAGAVVPHRWESLPRGPSLQGFCTSRTGEIGAGIDWFVGGFDLADADSCPDRNRGLVSDLLVQTIYERLHAAGLRTCVIHNFYHGAVQPWTGAGRDQWWHLSNAEMRTVKDVCSDEDVDQYEPFDAASFVKAHALLRFRPSTVKAKFFNPSANRVQIMPITSLRADRLAGLLDGGFPDDRFRGEAHDDGPPDLTTIYLSSVDKGSHVGGLANQETYLAWHDNRLAHYLDDYRRLYPRDFNNTVFALVADHGHQDLVPGAGITQSVAVALFEVLLGFPEGEELSLTDLLRGTSLAAGRAAVLSQGMNVYVYLGEPEDIPDFGIVPSVLGAARMLMRRQFAVTPYAALVKDRSSGTYGLLPRGEDDPVPLDSDRAREVITAHLDLPVPDEADLAATAVRSNGVDNERRLREQLAADPFGTLRVQALIEGLQAPPGSNLDRSPDIILLAPEKEAFTGSPATHGSFAYPLLRVPMVFCGPAVRADGEIAAADMVDFTPTIMSLLGVAPTDPLDGRARLDYYGRPLRRLVTAPLPPVKGPIVFQPQAVAPPPPAPSATEADWRVADGSAENLVVVELEGGAPARALEVTQGAGARVSGEAAGTAVHRITVRLPHVPEWLSAMVTDAYESCRTVVRHEDGAEEAALTATALCALVEAVGDRIAIAAFTRANEAVEHALTVESADEPATEELRRVWGAVLDCIDSAEREPDVLTASVTTAERAAMRCGGEVGEALAHLSVLGLRRRLDPSAPDVVGDACAAIEGMLSASDVGDIAGLRWS